MNPYETIRSLKGVGPKKEGLFHKIGIANYSDLLYYYPKRYEKRTFLENMEQGIVGEKYVFYAKVAKGPVSKKTRTGLTVTRYELMQKGIRVDAVFFNNPYIKRQIRINETFCFFGKLERNFNRFSVVNPFVKKSAEQLDAGRLLPVYPLKQGIAQKDLQNAVKQVLKGESFIQEMLSETVRNANDLMHKAKAVQNMHFPKDEQVLESARRRLVVEELLEIFTGLKSRTDDEESPVTIEVTEKIKDKVQNFIDGLPFSLTEDQQKAIDEIIRDLQSGKRVNRLLQGDVGSGKTIVAIVLQYLFHLCGYQSVMMAPTELLANQHGESIKRFFADTGLSFALLKGKMSDAEKEKTMEEIASGKVSLVIGTHALIQSSVRFHRLGLIITDEQHRFGVEQRKSLYQKSSAPHKVVMSATPIPRTISHVIYGDLDLSLIKTMPKGRKPVKTYCCRMSYLKKVFQSMEKEFLAGRQAFIVCPEIEYDEEPEKARTYSLEYVYEKIQGTFLGKYRIGILHGKMKKEEKDEVMQRFRNRELDLLIATTVIEVGIDVSNATVILVLSAERFGLSTLHQLRGRVGRGDMQGYCFFATDSESEKAMQRMKVLTEHQDGFAIAEEDLRLRGPGDYFGLKQHGMPGFELTNLSDDFEEIELARGIISTLNEEQKRFYTKKFKEKTNLD